MGMLNNGKRGEVWLLSALICTFLLAACAGAPKTGPFLLHPFAEELPGGYMVREGAVFYSDKIVEAEVRPLDIRFVARELAAAGKANPFSLPDEGIPEFQVMEVRLKNKGDEPLYFNPATVRGVDDENNRYMPMAFADFYQLHKSDASRDRKLGTFSSVCYDGHRELKPGMEEKKYLPLSSHATIPRAVVVTVQLIYAGRVNMSLSFVFEAFPLDEREARGSDAGMLTEE